MVDSPARCPQSVAAYPKTWSCSISTPATTATTHGTPSSPVTIYRSHAVTLPAATTAVFTFGFGTPTVTELKDRDGIDVLHHGHRYSILPPSLHPETGQPYTWVHDPKHRWRTYRNG